MEALCIIKLKVAVTNLLTGNTEYMKTIIELGGIKLFVKLLSSYQILLRKLLGQ